jgi:hypothetical protein
MKQLIAVSSLLLAFGVAAQETPPAREMNVTQGPDAVFEQAPAEILPALAGARATGENGRVGSELVFWGFERADGQRVFFFACARRPDFDCATRVPAICPAATTVLETRETDGTLVRRSCRNVSVVSPGEVRPGCADRVENASMAVGLVTCG